LTGVVGKGCGDAGAGGTGAEAASDGGLPPVEVCAKPTAVPAIAIIPTIAAPQM